MHVLEEEVRRVGIAAEDGALGAVRPPFPAGRIFRPDDLIDHNEADLAQQHGEVGRQRKREQAMVGVLVDVGGHDAELSTRCQDPITLLEDRTDTFDEVAVALDRPEVPFTIAVIRLVPVGGAGDDKTYAVALDEIHLAAIAVDHDERLEVRSMPVAQLCAVLLDDLRVAGVLIDADRAASQRDGRPGRGSGSCEGIQHGFTIKAEQLCEPMRNLKREHSGMVFMTRVGNRPDGLGVVPPLLLGELAFFLVLGRRFVAHGIDPLVIFRCLAMSAHGSRPRRTVPVHG